MIKVSKYLSNVSKSVGYSLYEMTKNDYSTISDFSETNSELFKEAYSGLKNYRTTYQRIVSSFKKSKVFVASKEAINSIKEDIKTGDFYNKARQEAFATKYGGDMMSEDDFDIGDFGFDDDSEWDMSDGDLLVAKASTKASKLASTHISDTIVRTADAQIENSRELASMQYAHSIELTKTINKNIENLGVNIDSRLKDFSSMAKINSDNTIKFYDTVGKTLSGIADDIKVLADAERKRQDPNFGKKEQTKKAGENIEDIADGGIVNLKAYGEKIKKNAFEYANQNLGGVLSMFGGDTFGKGGNMLANMAANPLQSLIAEPIAKSIINSQSELRYNLQNLNDSLQGIFPALMARANTMADKDEYDGGKKIYQILGSIFGIKDKRQKTINTANFNKSQVPWDGVSKKYLEEVIPYYLRKMTAALTGERETVFDPNTGRWTDIGIYREQFAIQENNRSNSALSELRGYINNLLKDVRITNQKDYASLQKDLDTIARRIYNEGDIDLKDKSGSDLGVSDNALNIFRMGLESADNKTRMSIVNNINSQKKQASDYLKQAEEQGGLLFKLVSENIDLYKLSKDKDKGTRVKGLNDHLNEFGELDVKNSKSPIGKAMFAVKDKYGQTMFDYLKGFKDELENFRKRGMYVYGNIGGGGMGGNHSGPRDVRNIDPREKSIHDGLDMKYEHAPMKGTEKYIHNKQNEEDSYNAQTKKMQEDTKNNGNINFIDLSDEGGANRVRNHMAQVAKDEADKRKKEWLDEKNKDSEIKNWFGITQDRVYREKHKNDSESLSFRDKFDNADTIGEKLFLVKDKLSSFFDKPSDLLNKAVLAADNHLYNMLYKSSTKLVDEDGKPVEGFMELLKYNATKTFNEIRTNASIFFGDAKQKFKDSRIGQWLEELKESMFGDETGKGYRSWLSPLMEKLESNADDVFQMYKKAVLETLEKNGIIREDENGDYTFKTVGQTSKEKFESDKNNLRTYSEQIATRNAYKRETIDKIDAMDKDTLDTLIKLNPEMAKAVNDIRKGKEAREAISRMRDMINDPSKYGINEEYASKYSELLNTTLRDYQKEDKLSEDELKEKQKTAQSNISAAQNSKKAKEDEIKNYQNILLGKDENGEKKEYTEDQIKNAREKIKEAKKELEELETKYNESVNEHIRLDNKYKRLYGDETKGDDEDVNKEALYKTIDKSSEFIIDLKTNYLETLYEKFEEKIKNAKDKKKELKEMIDKLNDEKDEFNIQYDSLRNQLAAISGNTKNKNKRRNALINKMNTIDQIIKIIDNNIKILESGIDNEGKTSNKIKMVKMDYDEENNQYVIKELGTKNVSNLSTQESKLKQNFLQFSHNDVSIGDILNSYGKDNDLFKSRIEGYYVDENGKFDESKLDEKQKEWYQRYKEKEKIYKEFYNNHNEINSISNSKKDLENKIKNKKTELNLKRNEASSTEDWDKVDTLLSELEELQNELKETKEKLDSFETMQKIASGNNANSGKDKKTKQEKENEKKKHNEELDKRFEAFKVISNPPKNDDDTESLASGGIYLGNGTLKTAVSSGEYINGKVVPPGGPYLTTLNKYDTVVNPASRAKQRMQKKQEQKFIKTIHSNAEANDGINKITLPEPIQKLTAQFKNDIGVDGIAKGIIGMGASGLLLGMPLLGAGLGLGASVVKNNQDVNSALFGSLITDENGKTVGHLNDGILPASLQEAFPDAKRLGLTGSLLGFLTPFGPVGGLLMGAGLGFAKNTQIVQDELFGFDAPFSEENRAKIKKELPKIGLGALIGAIASPFGLIPGALLGGAAGFVSTTDKFKDFMFGEEDANGKRSGGLVGTLKETILDPLTGFMKEIGTSIKDFIYNDLLTPVVKAINPIMNEIKHSLTSAFMFIPNIIKDSLEESLKNPLANLINDNLVKPLRSGLGKLIKGALKIVSLPIKLPAKMIGGIGEHFKRKQIRKGRSNLSAAERNAERNKHGFSFNVLHQGQDKYKTIDANLEEMSNKYDVGQIEELRNSLLAHTGNEKALQKALIQNQEEISSEISNSFSTNFVTGSAQKIEKLIKKGEYEKAANLIRNTDTKNGGRLSTEEADNIIKKMNQLATERENIKNKQKAYTNVDAEKIKYLTKSLGIEWDEEKNGKRSTKELIKLLDIEIKNKNKMKSKFGEDATKIQSAYKDVDSINNNTDAVKNLDETIKDIKDSIDATTKALNYKNKFGDDRQRYLGSEKVADMSDINRFKNQYERNKDRIDKIDELLKDEDLTEEQIENLNNEKQELNKSNDEILHKLKDRESKHNKFQTGHMQTRYRIKKAESKIEHDKQKFEDKFFNKYISKLINSRFYSDKIGLLETYIDSKFEKHFIVLNNMIKYNHYVEDIEEFFNIPDELLDKCNAVGKYTDINSMDMKKLDILMPKEIVILCKYLSKDSTILRENNDTNIRSLISNDEAYNKTKNSEMGSVKTPEHISRPKHVVFKGVKIARKGFNATVKAAVSPIKAVDYFANEAGEDIYNNEKRNLIVEIEKVTKDIDSPYHKFALKPENLQKMTVDELKKYLNKIYEDDIKEENAKNAAKEVINKNKKKSKIKSFFNKFIHQEPHTITVSDESIEDEGEEEIHSNAETDDGLSLFEKIMYKKEKSSKEKKNNKDKKELKRFLKYQNKLQKKDIKENRKNIKIEEKEHIKLKNTIKSMNEDWANFEKFGHMPNTKEIIKDKLSEINNTLKETLHINKEISENTGETVSTLTEAERIEMEKIKKEHKKIKKGSKEEADKRDENKGKFGVFTSMRDKISELVDKFKNGEEGPKKKSFLSKVFETMGKVIFGLKIIGGVPLLVGFGRKYVTPWLKEKIIPAIVGTKNGDGEYEGGIMSPLANGIKEKIDGIKDTINEKYGDFKNMIRTEVVPRIKTVFDELVDTWKVGAEVILKEWAPKISTFIIEYMIPFSVEKLCENLPDIITSAIKGAGTGIGKVLGFGGKDEGEDKKTDNSIAAKAKADLGIDKKYTSADISDFFNTPTENNSDSNKSSSPHIPTPQSNTNIIQKQTESMNLNISRGKSHSRNGSDDINQETTTGLSRGMTHYRNSEDSAIETTGLSRGKSHSRNGSNDINQETGLSRGMSHSRNGEDSAIENNKPGILGSLKNIFKKKNKSDRIIKQKVAPSSMDELRNEALLIPFLSSRVGKEMKDIETQNQNAQLYNQYAGVGTNYLNENYSDEINNNESFQNVRDKEVDYTNAGGYHKKSLAEKLARSFTNGAALGKNVAKLFTKPVNFVLKGTSKIPGMKIGSKIIKGVNNTAEKLGGLGSKLAKGDTANISKKIKKIQNWINKIFTKLSKNEKIMKAFSKAAGDAAKNPEFEKKFAKAMIKFGTNLSEKLAKESVEKVLKVAAKASNVIGWVLIIKDFFDGWDNARNILGIVDDDVSIMERFFAGMISLVEGLIPIPVGADNLCDFLLSCFSFVSDDAFAELKKKRDEAEQAIDLYNAENGTDFETVEEFNNAVNPTKLQKIKNFATSAFNKVFGKEEKNKESSVNENGKGGGSNSRGGKKDKVASNAETNDGLTPFDNIKNRLVTGGKEKLNKYTNTIQKYIKDPISDLLGEFKETDIYDKLKKFTSMNKAIRKKISSGKLLASDKNYWKIHTNNDNSFSASLFKLSEFMQRVVKSPVLIMQNAIDGILAAETGGTITGTTTNTSSTSTSSITTMTTDTANSTASTTTTDVDKEIEKESKTNSTTTDSSKTESKTTTGGVVSKLFKSALNLFKKKSGKGKYDETTVTNNKSLIRNLKLDYLIPPKPLDDEQVNYIKSQYSGGSRYGKANTDHIYQRDYDDQFNISGDSEFQTIGDSGCGPVVASQLLQRYGKSYNVRDAANEALKYKEPDGGTYPEYFDNYLKKQGVSTQNLQSKSDVYNKISKGNSVILMGQSPKSKNTPFGKSNPHYVLATGMAGDKVIVQDPEDPLGNALYDAENTINDSIYAINTINNSGSSRKNKYGKGKRRMSGLGKMTNKLTDKQENTLFGILHEIILRGEGGGSYSIVCCQDAGSGMSFGAIGAHQTNAEKILKQIAERVPDADDKNFLLYMAKEALNTGGITQSDADKLTAVLDKYTQISKEVQDNYAYDLYKDVNLRFPMELFNSGRLQNPLSMVVPADIYNTGPNGRDYWADGFSSPGSGPEEVDAVVNKMLKDSWWGTTSNQYHDAWCNRIKSTGETVRNLNLDTYVPGTILGSDFVSSGTVSGDSMGSTGNNDNTLIGKISKYVTTAFRGLYGGLYDALFGTPDTGTTSTSTGLNKNANGDDAYNGLISDTTADGWFLGTLDGSFVSSGYRLPDRPDHQGIDYAAGEGLTIYSPVDGVVVYSQWNTGGYGNLVIVEDTFGYYHIFGHQCELSKLKVGDEVLRGDYIGLIGTTGHSTGPHLHYQVNKSNDMWNADIDPNTYPNYGVYAKAAEERFKKNSANSTTAENEESTIVVNDTSGEGNDLTINRRKSGKGNKKITDIKITDKSGKSVSINVDHNKSRIAKNNSGIMSTETYDSGTSNNSTKYNAKRNSNKNNMGGEYQFGITPEMMLTIVNLLGNISSNTHHLNEVVELLSKLSIANAQSISGTANKHIESKDKDDTQQIMNQLLNTLSKAKSSNGLNLGLLNSKLNTNNDTSALETVYRIASM